MRDAAEIGTLPLNHVVWEAWLSKNRAKEQRFNARMAKIMLTLAAAGLVLSFLWLGISRYRSGDSSKPLLPTSSGFLVFRAGPRTVRRDAAWINGAVF